MIDKPLREALRNKAIRLLRCSWLLSSASNDALGRDDQGRVRMVREQDLPEEAFLTPEEAAALLLEKKRSIFVLSYGCESLRLERAAHGEAAPPCCQEVRACS